MYKLKTLGFPALFTAVAVFFFIFFKEHAVDLFAFIPAVVGLAIVATNNEEPIEQGRLMAGCILCVISALTCGIVGATNMWG